MTMKVVQQDDAMAMILDKRLTEKLNLTANTEFEFRTEGTRIILYPLEIKRELIEGWVL